ncbi:hypothetical protein [Sphingobacterium bovistauri]|uniref:DUF3592 domain-containing protein n=1 Tax=Sphingobacterium bovistauri TaxID=2781959 RepID=A0ABS7Z0N2_9SPHI|nr:hypothetical protein [Sphingobacterium bovistauri]MCA5003727.1 hypothetical protein [Sphingobacterium bovistauri]
MFEQKAFAWVGLIFTLTAIGTLFLVNTISNSKRSKYEDYDYKNIELLGTETKASITYINIKYNVKYNRKSPVVFSYQYKSNGKPANDEFETIDWPKVSHLNVGDTISIKFYQNQSAMMGVEPFTFAMKWVFCIIPLVFAILGITFLSISIVPARKKYLLYKTGDVKEAEILGIDVGNAFVSQSGDKVYNSSTLQVNVTYCYYKRNGRKKTNEALTKDHSFLTDYKVGDKIKVMVSQNEISSCLIPEDYVSKHQLVV